MKLKIFLSLFLVQTIVLSYSVFSQEPEMKFKIHYGDNSKTGKFAAVNGIQMYYEEYGKGMPMILIHGNGGSIADMSFQIQYFSKNYHVIVADSRAHGKSGAGEGRLTYEQMASDWSALLDQLKIDSAYIIGWSDGGILSLLMAIHYPQKVKMFAAMGANLQPDSSAVYPWAVKWVGRTSLQINSMIEKKDSTQPWHIYQKHFDLLGNQPNIPLSDLHKISAPALILAGDKDVITLEHTDLIFENIPHAHLCIFPGATHMIPVQNPALFNKTVEQFFSIKYNRPDTKEIIEGIKF